MTVTTIAAYSFSGTDAGEHIPGKKCQRHPHCVKTLPFTGPKVSYSCVKAPPQKLFEADRASLTHLKVFKYARRYPPIFPTFISFLFIPVVDRYYRFFSKIAVLKRHFVCFRKLQVMHRHSKVKATERKQSFKCFTDLGSIIKDSKI